MEDFEDSVQLKLLHYGLRSALKKQCPDPQRPIFCNRTRLDTLSDNVPSPAKSDQCVASYMHCFHARTTEFVSTEPRGGSTPQHWCHLTGWATAQSDCVPLAAKCPAAAPYRCKDWTCVDNVQGIGCETQQVMCGDRVLCADASCASSVEECASTTAWLGCAPGNVECKQQNGLCAESEAHCVNQTGCAAGTVTCGYLRDPDTLQPLLAEWVDATGAVKWRPVADCKAACETSYSADAVLGPASTILHIDADDSAKSTFAYTHDLQAVALKIKVKDRSVYTRFDAKTTPLRFKIQPVTDSIQHTGTFQKFLERHTLRSLLTIEPLELLQITSLGFELQLAVPGDAAIRVDYRTCGALVADIQVLAASDVSDAQQEPSFVAFCRPVLFLEPSEGLSTGNCSCAVDTMHFATFALIDAQADRMLRAKEMSLSVLQFFVFLPLSLIDFTTKVRTRFMTSMLAVYSSSTLRVELLLVEDWPPPSTGLPAPTRRALEASAAGIRISMRVSSVAPFAKVASSKLSTQLLRNGLPAALSGITLPENVSTEKQSRPFLTFLLFFVLGIVVCGSICWSCCYAKNRQHQHAHSADPYAHSTDYLSVADQSFAVLGARADHHRRIFN